LAHFTPQTLPSDEQITTDEIAAMAAVLTRRYGPRAGEIAQHFTHEHEVVGDHVRANVWQEVQAQLAP